jgi:hypothetical protein
MSRYGTLLAWAEAMERPEIAALLPAARPSLFNALTGSRQKVANYAGVTVERKAGAFVTKYPAGRQVTLLDLPGTYSLRGRSPDEEITRDVVLGKRPGEAAPDLVLCIADATNLRLTLRLILELKRTGRRCWWCSTCSTSRSAAASASMSMRCPRHSACRSSPRSR